ncbi:MAG: L,D-transpeptidase ErfK/SrfK [Acidobacteriota bacterium]|nr:L,D-transpeptidase ErfK/SrfK [Acidobacteriota bacterium]
MTTLQRATLAVAAALSFLITLSLAGCTNAPVTNAPTTNANAANMNATNTNAASAANVNASSAVNTSASEQPVTLAVLDALFADESFGRDLKSKLQLSDDQIAQLHKVAAEERNGLRESDANAQSGSTRDATERARQRIGTVVGADKADQVIAFARDRWSGDEGGPSSAPASATANKSNEVPTDTRIVVNAPAFRMDIFEQGRLVKSYKVGIGYPEFPLPAGMRKADQIIYNPEWTPPDEPWVESGSSKVKVGEKVASGSKLNPLGPVKIPIGLPSLIHGGKQPSRLGEFASHGCVGLTNDLSLEVAREIARLGGANVSDEDVKNYQQDKTKPKSVKLPQPVRVELRYETIVATDDGKLHIYRDVYDRGTNTEENLRKVLDAHGVSFDQLSDQQRAQLTDALKQMARDALGHPAEGDGTESMNASASNKNGNASNASANASNKNSNASNKSDKNANKADAQGAHVTRNVKGQKEIVVEIEALRGKGYPAPVGDAFSTNGQKQTATAAKKENRR